MNETPPVTRMHKVVRVQRTRSGCQTCRTRKIKCDEHRPVCSRCLKGNRTCNWASNDRKRSRPSRRPNATACDFCREKKLRCIGDVRDKCDRCRASGIDCLRAPDFLDRESPALSTNKNTLHVLQKNNVDQNRHSSRGRGSDSANTSIPESEASASISLGRLPDGNELEELVQLYFASVHHFGFFAFVNPIHFRRLCAQGKPPRELTLMMIASAMRFAAPVTPGNIAKADAWADAAIQSLTPQIYQGFGVIQLMALLLAQHYDLARGKFTSAWLLGASCARMMQMMSLHTFDRKYPADFPSPHRLSPLLSREALRRVAWCTFYLDTMIDGGRYGSQTIEERSFRIQLPCDQESFLSNEHVKTEPLFLGRMDSSNPMEANLPRAPLDMWAYILRAAAARRRVLHFAFRASHQDQPIEQLSTQLSALQADVEEVIAALPRRLQFNTDNVFLHHDRLGTFILLHVLRHNLFIILGRAALLIFSHDPTRKDLVVQARRSRIAHALAISGLVKEGLEKNIIFDPHIGIQAYVALEILLFEPRRLAAVDISSDPKSPEFIKAIGHLLTVIRHLSGRSEFSKDLYLEAAYRMIKCDFTRLLSQEDLTLLQSHDHNLVGQDVAEYDFRDFRKARAERLAHLSRTSSYHVMHAAPDEVLLDDSIGRETPEMQSAPSPRLDALDVCNTIPQNSAVQVPPTGPHDDSNSSAGVNVEGYGAVRAEWPLGQFIESEDADDLFSSLHWFWSLNESTDDVGSSPLPDAFQSVYL